LKELWAKKQRGYTLIEVTVALAITALLGIGILVAMTQLRGVNDLNNSNMTAVKQVENAVHYINRDVQMARTVETEGEDEDGGNYWLKLCWSTWEDNVDNKVLYLLEDGSLVRQYYKKGPSETEFSLENERTIAVGINSNTATAPNPTPSPTTLPPEKAWTITISAVSQSGSKQATETREVRIIPRPGS